MPVARNATLKDGSTSIKHIVYYVGPDGKRTSKSFDQKSKALAFEKSVRADREAHKKKPIIRGRMTYGDLRDRYLSDSALGRDGNDPWKKSTVRKAKEDAGMVSKFLPDDTLAKHITPSKIREVRKLMQESHYARSTLVGVFKQIKAVLQHAMVEEIITSNPAQGITLKLPKTLTKSGTEFEVFTKAEVTAILKTADKRRQTTKGKTKTAAKNNWLIPHVLVETGMRVGELLALTWENVDLDAGEVRVIQSFMKEDKEPVHVKTAAGVRTLQISRSLADALRIEKERRTTKYVFETGTGQPFQYRNLLRWFHETLEEAGVRIAGFHKARHYYASRLIEMGVDAKVLTTNMGHADVAFTLEVYGHLFDDRDTRDRKREIAEQMSALSQAA